MRPTIHKSVVGRQQMVRDRDLITRVTNPGDAPVDVTIVIGHSAVGCTQHFTLQPGCSRGALDGEHAIPVYALEYRDIWIQADSVVTVECVDLDPSSARRIRGPIEVGGWIIAGSEMAPRRHNINAPGSVFI